MEKAIIYNKNETKIKIIYCGDEFCEFKLIKNIPSKIIKWNKYILMTPILTNKYLKKVLNLIDKYKFDEISVNDIGLLFYLIESKINIKINLGRIFVNNNYHSFYGTFFKEKIIKKINIIESDDTKILKQLDLLEKDLAIHVKYKYLTFTKNCIIKHKNTCNKSKYCLNYNEMKPQFLSSEKLYIKGNAYFVKYKITKISNIKNIKRIIYHEN